MSYSEIGVVFLAAVVTASVMVIVAKLSGDATILIASGGVSFPLCLRIFTP